MKGEGRRMMKGLGDAKTMVVMEENLEIFPTWLFCFSPVVFR